MTLARVHGQVCEGVAGASWCEDFVHRAWLTIGRMAPSRASFVLLRDELLEREAFDTLPEANGALRAVAAALQHDPTTQCLGIPAPDTRVVAAPCVRMAYASANTRGWSIGGQNPNLRIGVIHGGRSVLDMQRANLMESLGRVLAEIYTHQRPLRVFRQLKMHNGPR